MADLYYKLVSERGWDIDKVPLVYRAEVQAKLDA